MCKISRLGALLAGGLLVACSSPEAPAPPTTPSFDAQRAWSQLETIVAFGPRPSASPANLALVDYLEEQLKLVGLEPEREAFTSETPIGELAFVNLFADLAPADADAPWLLLMTHFDTKRFEEPFLGANDGGSGTAVLLELARVLATDPAPRKLGLRLLFLDGEEAVNLDWEGLDNTYGSRYHASQLQASGRATEFGAAVLIDMVGDADLNILHETYSRRELMQLFEQEAVRLGLGSIMEPNRPLPVKDDHLSFASIGIPSVDLIDFDYGPNNTYWHTPADTLEHCSADSLGAVGKLLQGSLPALERWVLAH